MSAGIYAIVNIENSKLYVGSATDLDSRRKTHFTRLRCGKHPSKHLQAAFTKYGEARFAFRVLEPVASAADLLAREQFWIDTLAPAYNKRAVASSNLGIHVTPEWRAAQREGLKAFRDSPAGAAHKEVLRAAVQKSWADPASRENRLTAIRATWTPERRAAASEIAKARDSHLAPDGVHFGTHRVWTAEEKAQSGEKQRAAWSKRLTTTEEDVRRIVSDSNPAWSVLALTGVRSADKVHIHCSTHNHDQWQTVAKLRYAQRGCKLCGYQRSSEVQKGRTKLPTI